MKRDLLVTLGLIVVSSLIGIPTIWAITGDFTQQDYIIGAAQDFESRTADQEFLEEPASVTLSASEIESPLSLQIENLNSPPLMGVNENIQLLGGDSFLHPVSQRSSLLTVVQEEQEVMGQFRERLNFLAQIQNALDANGNFSGKFGELLSEIVGLSEGIPPDQIEVETQTTDLGGNIYHVVEKYSFGQDRVVFIVYLEQKKDGQVTIDANDIGLVAWDDSLPDKAKKWTIRRANSIRIFGGELPAEIFDTYRVVRDTDLKQGQEITTREVYYLGQNMPIPEIERTWVSRKWETKPAEEFLPIINGLPLEIAQRHGLSAEQDWGTIGEFINTVFDTEKVGEEIRVIKYYEMFYEDQPYLVAYNIKNPELTPGSEDRHNIRIYYDIYNQGKIETVARFWWYKSRGDNPRDISIYLEPDSNPKGSDEALPEDFRESTMVFDKIWNKEGTEVLWHRSFGYLFHRGETEWYWRF